MNSIELLKTLYENDSKHSNYQVLTRKLAKLIAPEQISTNSRYEHERLAYLKKHLTLKDKTLLDIGGNTGFFTFECLDAGASIVDYYEGNQYHADFVRTASKVLKYDDKVNVHNTYYPFNGKSSQHYDIILLLNVLHHVGDDYGEPSTSIDKARELIIHQINNMSVTCDVMVLQLGFCWKGNITMGLFEHGTKQEMIEYLKNGIDECWEILHIGIAEKNKNEVTYEELSDHNIARSDEIGEFLNRPLFILKSRSVR